MICFATPAAAFGKPQYCPLLPAADQAGRKLLKQVIAPDDMRYNRRYELWLRYLVCGI
jgi:hypothetical protein